MSTPTKNSNDVSLLTAYILWLFGGIYGFHHAYLGRYYQSFLWAGSLSLFGWGWLRDGYMLPYYVALANSNPTDPRVRIQRATVEARNGIPARSFLRFILMLSYGGYFGKIVSCLGVSTETGSPVDGTLYAIGAAFGIYLVGNIGEETIKSPRYIVVACGLGHLCVGLPSLVGAIYATYQRAYRHSMTIPLGPGGRPSTIVRRLGRHVVNCMFLSALLLTATFNHGGIVVNGRTVYVKDAFYNAINSRFWQEFRFEDFRYRSREGGQDGASDYFKWLFDLEGERTAYRTLGVPMDADYAEVKKAYKTLARKYHPDKISHDATEYEVERAKEKFMRVQEAYEVLTKIEKDKKSRENNERGQDEYENQGYGSDEM